MAARTVIVRQGLEATTLRDIAREGGFTTGVVSHYFPDKTARRSSARSPSRPRSGTSSSSAHVTAAPTAEQGLVNLVRVSIPTDPVYRAGVAAVVGDVDVRRA